jgi:hypothetical protein
MLAMVYLGNINDSERAFFGGWNFVCDISSLVSLGVLLELLDSSLEFLPKLYDVFPDDEKLYVRLTGEDWENDFG